MKQFILKFLGINLQEIRAYNEAKQREADIEELRRCEKKITEYMRLYKNDVLLALRTVTEDGFPVIKYKDLCMKYKLYDKDNYNFLSLASQKPI